MRWIQWWATLIGLAGLQACTTEGELLEADAALQSVAFSWVSHDGGMTGSMTARLAEASFQGRFFQITQQTRYETLSPLWTHWNHGWSDWPEWSGPLPPGYPTPQFITHYSGKVLATLSAANNERMRCRFHLVAPARGMSGGGEGQCQLTGGRVVKAVFIGS
jgi:hypothetical protein